MAMAVTAAVFSGQRKINLIEGRMAIAHGSSNGRLLVFALVIIAAASTDAKKSRDDREIFGAQREVHRRQRKRDAEQIIPDAARLEHETITGRRQPHPMPRHPPPHPQPGEHG